MDNWDSIPDGISGQEEEKKSPEDSDKAEPVVQVRKCTCGIEVSKASMCSEPDCPYRG